MKLKYKLVIGLYAYLRQLELSLDRAMPTNIDEMAKYFSLPGVYQPIFVANYFKNLIQEKEDFLFIKYPCDGFFSWLFKKKSLLLKVQDMKTIVNTLDKIGNFSNINYLDSDELVNMRIFLNRISWDFIGSKLNYEDRLNAHTVEHYNQSKYILFKKIDNILNENWLE